MAHNCPENHYSLGKLPIYDNCVECPNHCFNCHKEGAKLICNEFMTIINCKDGHYSKAATPKNICMKCPAKCTTCEYNYK